mmetsp:Transcript_32808/g.93097  ORF Transcript_32808/g.93097 Transcript_32808/m.93097 type:complete len:195 (+) Transcript_32808:236-820(+)
MQSPDMPASPKRDSTETCQACPPTPRPRKFSRRVEDKNRQNPVRRRLFGAPSVEESEEHRLEMESRAQEYISSVSSRWNFDFDTDTPLHGIWRWEPCNSNADREPDDFGADLSRLETENVCEIFGRIDATSSSSRCGSPESSSRVDFLSARVPERFRAAATCRTMPASSAKQPQLAQVDNRVPAGRCATTKSCF